MFLPPIITPFICSRASDAASGISYSMNANPVNVNVHSIIILRKTHFRSNHRYSLFFWGNKDFCVILRCCPASKTAHELDKNITESKNWDSKRYLCACWLWGPSLDCRNWWDRMAGRPAWSCLPWFQSWYFPHRFCQYKIRLGRKKRRHTFVFVGYWVPW